MANTKSGAVAQARCGLNHTSLKTNPALWLSLTYVGVQHTPADEFGPATTLELRNCPCGSTLCVEVAS